jgi:hypothetical protein
MYRHEEESMNENDALMAVVGRVDGAGPMDESNYKWRLVAIEMVIRILYALGFEIRERDGNL